MSENLNQITHYSGNENIEAVFIIKDDDIWGTTETITDLFKATIPEVISALRKIFETEELSKSEHHQEVINDSKHVSYYSREAIISVGFALNSKKSTQFRLWSSKTLKQYFKDGYVINEALLRSDPKKLNQLAAKIRELRATEKNVYASVRECFKLAASDYEPSSKEVRKFYSLLQDKFHHAIAQMTASKLILDRANHAEKNMGVQTIAGLLPTKEETQNGKNYLTENEIYRMHLLSEQFLLFTESTALMEKQMTMKSLHEQLDNILKLNGYPVFEGYEDFLKTQAITHAEREYKIYIELKKLELLGIDVDLDLFYDGEYDEYKDQTSQISAKQLRLAEQKKISA